VLIIARMDADRHQAPLMDLAYITPGGVKKGSMRASVLQPENLYFTVR
jgi:hypothetical protein